MSDVIGPISDVFGVGPASKAADAAENSANIAADASREGMGIQQGMYDTTRNDFNRFLDPSSKAMATLQSGIYGGSTQYADPNFRYNAATKKYIGPNGQSVDTPPMLSASYNPTESAGFQYTKNRTLEDLGRQLRMMGRGSGTVAANATGRTLGDLNAANEDRYKNDLLNLVKTGQGAAGTTSTLGTNTANSLSSLAQAAGNAQMQGGMAKANLYAGLSGSLSNSAAGGMQAYNYFKNQNYGSGAGAGAAAADTAVSADVAANAGYWF